MFQVFISASGVFAKNNIDICQLKNPWLVAVLTFSELAVLGDYFILTKLSALDTDR